MILTRPAATIPSYDVGGNYAAATISPEEYRKLMWRLASVPNGAAIALYTSLNKAAARGRTTTARLVAEAMTARISSVNKRLTVKKASSNSLHASLNLHGKHGVSLIGFSAKQNAQGVVAKVFGQAKQYPHAFIEKALGGRRVVFLREGQPRVMTKGRHKGKTRQPLVSLKGPTVSEVFEQTPGLVAKTLNDIDTYFQAVLPSQVEWLLNRKAP